MGRKKSGTTDLRKEFAAAGFEIEESGASPGTIGVKKYNCVQYLEVKPGQPWRPVGRPYFIIRGLNYELEDRGYQKFWWRQGTRIPVQKANLQTLHRFDEEVREILRSPCLYNEALGSTCARTVYDRLEGRPER